MLIPNISIIMYLVGRRHLFTVGGPEPTEDFLGLEVFTGFTTFEVAKTARRPDVRHII